MGAPVTQPNTSLAGSASSTSYVPGNYGVNTVAANCDTLSGVSPTNNQCLSMWGNGNFTISEITFLTTCIGCTLSQEDDLLLVDEIPYIDDNPIKKTIIGRFIDWMSNT